MSGDAGFTVSESILFTLASKPNLFLSHNGCVVFQRVAQHVATHALARLIVEILKERWEVLELQHGQDVVVGVHWNLQQSGELLGHSAAGCYAVVEKENKHRPRIRLLLLPVASSVSVSHRIIS